VLQVDVVSAAGIDASEGSAHICISLRPERRFVPESADSGEGLTTGQATSQATTPANDEHSIAKFGAGLWPDRAEVIHGSVRDRRPVGQRLPRTIARTVHGRVSQAILCGFDLPTCRRRSHTRCVSDEPTGRFTDDERELFYYETLSEVRVDDVMLHEPLWTLNGRYPTAPGSAREELAESTLLKLLDGGFIAVFRPGSQEPLSRDEARAVVAGSSWRTVPVSAVFDLVITPEGKLAHDRVPESTWDRVLPDRTRLGPRTGRG
jgi:hypothetical protein